MKEPKVIMVSNTSASSMRLIAAMATARGSFPDREIKPVVAVPDIVGAYGLAWMADIDAMQALAKTEEEAVQFSVLASWCVEAQGSHPIWYRYHLTLVHLRAMSEATLVYLPGATHELWLFALDPDSDIDRFVSGARLGDGYKWLTPCNFAAQMIYPDDAAAVLDIRAVVASMVCLGFSPDTDNFKGWVERFNDSLVRKGI